MSKSLENAILIPWEDILSPNELENFTLMENPVDYWPDTDKPVVVRPRHFDTKEHLVEYLFNTNIIKMLWQCKQDDNGWYWIWAAERMP